MFNNKKDMVDIRELQRRGILRIPKEDIEIATNREGYIELEALGLVACEEEKPPKFQECEEKKQEAKDNNQNANLSFFDLPIQSNSTNSQNFSIEKDGYSKREVDRKMEMLDNRIYKLEQRIEVLERKAGVGGAW
ncbi:MAG: hypothetical protein ACOYT4_03745 [Nanoarchaeota archaeon]